MTSIGFPAKKASLYFVDQISQPIRGLVFLVGNDLNSYPDSDIRKN